MDTTMPRGISGKEFMLADLVSGWCLVLVEQ